MQPQVQIINVCDYCQGKAYLPYETTAGNGETVIRHSACPQCQGTGRSQQWITIEEFVTLLDGSFKEADRILEEYPFGEEGPVTAYQDSLESAGIW